MKLTEVNQSQKDSYNRFVMESESGSFLQSYEWGEWQSALGRQVIRFQITDESGEIISTIQLIKISLPFGRYYLYAPYGPVVDHNFQFLIFNFQKYIKEKFPDAVFVRIEPKDQSLATCYMLHATKSVNIQPGKTLVIDLSKTEENLLSEMHSKTRYNIRLAQKHGVIIQSDLAITPGHGLYFKEVINQISETEKRQEYKGHGKGYYKKMVDFFALHNQGEIKVHIYKALLKNELLASAIMLDFSAKGGSASGGGTRTYLFGGSSDTQKNIMAPYVLHWRAILDAKAAGLEFYDFWGIETSSGRTPGFARFKQGFGGKTLEYSGAFDIPINQKFYWLYKIARRLRF